MVSACGAERSAPPLATPPLSTRVMATVSHPKRCGDGRMQTVPSASTRGGASSSEASPARTATSNVRRCSASYGRPDAFCAASAASGAGRAPRTSPLRLSHPSSGQTSVVLAASSNSGAWFTGSTASRKPCVLDALPPASRDAPA